MTIDGAPRDPAMPGDPQDAPPSGSKHDIAALIDSARHGIEVRAQLRLDPEVDGSRLPGRHTQLLDTLPLDTALVRRIVQTLPQSLMLEDLGKWTKRIRDDVELAQSSQPLNIDLRPIIGTQGMQHPTPKKWHEVLHYTAAIDGLGLLALLETSIDRAVQLRAADLNSLFEVNQIACTLAASGALQSGRLRILEIGGGYGRLAEALFAALPGRIERYVLVDAVPTSLASAHAYLSTPGVIDADVELNLAGSPSRDSCIVILPSWRTQVLAGEEVYDLAINIESFQEMATRSVNTYLGLIDRMLGPSGVSYFTNSRCYSNRESWQFPEHWRLQFSGHTPRSWSAQHSTLIWEKPPYHDDTFADLRRAVEIPWRS